MRFRRVNTYRSTCLPSSRKISFLEHFFRMFYIEISLKLSDLSYNSYTELIIVLQFQVLEMNHNSKAHGNHSWGKQCPCLLINTYLLTHVPGEGRGNPSYFAQLCKKSCLSVLLGMLCKAGDALVRLMCKCKQSGNQASVMFKGILLYICCVF